MNSALAVGLTMLMYALDTIKLGKMPYQKVSSKLVNDGASGANYRVGS